MIGALSVPEWAGTTVCAVSPAANERGVARLGEVGRPLDWRAENGARQRAGVGARARQVET